MDIAVIPARAGSKRIPRKNIRDFAGKPMIAYAIAAARQWRGFSHVVVSTEDEEIARVARQHGAETPFVRPAFLADDHVGTVPIIAHSVQACRSIGWSLDRVCCIYPCVPLLQAVDLGNALLLLEKDGADFAFPVARFPSAIQRALRRLPDSRMQPFNAENTETRTQDLEPAYYDVGQFYWGRAEAWLKGVSPHLNGMGLVVPEWRVVDIDTEEDWTRAELIHQLLTRSRK